MLPKTSIIPVPVKIKETVQPSKTFALDLEKQRICSMTEGLDAVKQAVYCILNTERYRYLIYSWNYGVELDALYGRPIPYVKTELKRRITEALTQDDRIRDVGAFLFGQSEGKLSVAFTVYTVFGEFRMEKEVEA